MSVKGAVQEIAYEFRISNDAILLDATKQGKFKGGSKERIGELIKEGAVKTTLSQRDNRNVIFRIPLRREIQEKLRNHPHRRVKLSPGNISPEVIKQSHENELKAQNFLFYCFIEIYDARLKKTITIPATRIWPFGGYPDARFKIEVEIKSNGGYSVNSSFPEETRPTHRTVIGK